MSNLLDKASIVLTPTAYNNGEALCVKPSDGSGDFDFSRNSAATRVNAQGLVENVQILSSNLVQNGDFSEEGAEEVSNGSFSQESVELVTNGSFDTDSDWDLRDAWVISNGVCSLTAPNSNYLSQSNVFTANKFYKLSFDIVVNSGNLEPQFFDGGFQTIGTYSTTQTVVVYFKSTTSGTIYFKPNSFDGSIDNVSVKEVGQDWDFGDGWSVGEDKANCDGSQSATSYLEQTLTASLSQNKIYKITYTATIPNGNLRPELTGNGGTSVGTSQTTSGTYTDYIKAEYNHIKFRFRGNADFNGSVTNISVKEVGQNWDLLNGTITDKYNASLTSYQNGIRVNPFTYTGTVKVTFDLVVTSGSCKFVAGGSNEQIYSTSGTKEIIVTNPSRFEFNAFNLGWVGTLDNVSAIQISSDTNLPRINYEGFSYQDALGSEEVVNGGFDTNLNNWVAYSNTLISWESGGYALLDSNNNFWCKIKQSNVFEIGKTYKVILTAKSDRTDLSFHNSPITGSFSEADTFETFEQYYTATTTDFLFGYANAGSATITIDNVSVKEVTGQEVVPDSGCGSWLFEPQSTNFITYSSDYTNGWINTGTTDVISSTMLSPNGLDYSTLLVGDVATASTKRIRNTVTPIASTAHTFSVFVKSANRTYIQIINSGDTQGYANFDVSNGMVGNTGSKTTANITPLNNNWYRCEVSTDATTINGGFMIYLVDSNTASFAASGTSTDGVYIWGAQLEALSYASSLIPTEGSTVTRNQDVCNNGGSLASINSTEGVLYAEIAALADNDNGYIGLFGSSNSRVRIVFSNQIKAQLFNGSYQCNIGFTQSQTNNNKIAFKYKENDFALWINGVEVGTDTSGLTFSANTLSYLNLGSYNGASNLVKGKTKCVAVFPYLSDEELTELTTI